MKMLQHGIDYDILRRLSTTPEVHAVAVGEVAVAIERLKSAQHALEQAAHSTAETVHPGIALAIHRDMLAVLINWRQALTRDLQLLASTELQIEEEAAAAAARERANP